MCTVLDGIRNKSAQELLEEHGLANKVPVDINQLLNSTGISAIEKDFSALELRLGKREGSISGMLRSDGNNAAIFYNKRDNYRRQKFTIAHELAHAMLHKDYNSHIEYRMTEDEISNDPTEIKANILAGELLIPLKLLAKVYMELQIPSSITLAERFDVSVNVMEARLNYLKVFYFDSKGNAITYE